MLNIKASKINIKEYFKNPFKLENSIYIEVSEIKNENDKITSSLTEIVYKDYLPENENIENEKVGNFLYLIGGITRESYNLSRQIYSKLLDYYKKCFKQNKNFNENEIRKKVSVWIKNNCNIKDLCKDYSIYNEDKINKYLDSCEDENTKIILKNDFYNFIELYTKCMLSVPEVEIEFEFDKKDDIFDDKKMIDIIITGNNTKKKINFCYLPLLKSNGSIMQKGYVFTYNGETYCKKGNLYECKNSMINNNMEKNIILNKNIDYNMNKNNNLNDKNLMNNNNIDNNKNINNDMNKNMNMNYNNMNMMNYMGNNMNPMNNNMVNFMNNNNSMNNMNNMGVFMNYINSMNPMNNNMMNFMNNNNSMNNMNNMEVFMSYINSMNQMNNMVNFMNNNNSMNNMNNMEVFMNYIKCMSPMNNMVNFMNNNNSMNNLNNMGNFMSYNNNMNNLNNMNYMNNMNNNNRNILNSIEIIHNINDVNYPHSPNTILPRTDKTLYLSNSFIENGINVIFEFYNGTKVIMNVSKNSTIKELLNKFLNKISVSNMNGLVFLFNGQKLYSEDNKNLVEMFTNNTKISVLEEAVVFGARQKN